MQDKEFIGIQRALRTATHEPAGVPPALLARTMRRCEAVTAGLEAEKHLRQAREDISFDELCKLTAAGVLGRAALKRNLPEGQSVSELTCQLAASPRLRGSLDGTAEDALRCLNSGVLLHGDAEKTAGKTKNMEGSGLRQTPKSKGGIQK